jgi:pentatricopeptide repeat protein
LKAQRARCPWQTLPFLSPGPCKNSVSKRAGGHWEKATEFFQMLQAQGCKPDSITFSALISAYEKGGQWRRALKALEQMQVVICYSLGSVS